MTSSNSRKKSKIAVVTVHGVSNQKKFNSAREIANLLLDNTTNKKANYSSFYEQIIHIMVRPGRIKSIDKNYAKSWIEDNLLAKKWWLTLFPDGRGAYTCKRLKTPFEQLEQMSFDDVDLDFTRDRLNNYQKSTVYDTICLVGDRITSDNQSQKVHIYEMYWADLSLLGQGFFHIFGGLFQLLFHLSSLGRPVVDSTRIKIRETPKLGDRLLDNQLKWWSRFQIWSSLTLSLLISNLNLYLLIAALLTLFISLISNYFPDKFLWTIPIIIGTIIAIASTRLVLYQSKILIKNVSSLPLIIGGLSSCLLWGLNFLVGSPTWFYYSLITVVWTTVLIVFYWLILIKPFDRHRPGAKGFAQVIGMLLLLITCGLILVNLLSPDNTYNSPEIFLTAISLNLIEIIYVIICFAWLCFNLLYLSTGICWIITFINLRRCAKKVLFHRSLKKKALLSKFKRVFLITQVSLILPAVLFLFVTLVIWQVLATSSSSLLLTSEFYQTLIIPLGFESGQQFFTPAIFLTKLISFAHSPLSNLISYIFIVLLVIIIYSFLPAIWADIKPPTIANNESYSTKLGIWLTTGFKNIEQAIIFALLIAPILGLLSNIFNISEIFSLHLTPDFLHSTNTSNPLAFRIAFVVVTASATSLIALGNRLNKLFLGLWGVLDTILDVDNYLRLHPQDDTPRGRIFARYLSLLRYLYEWRDPQDNQPYDGIVIVSHSQGTVITADLLRLLSSDLDDSLFPAKYKKPSVYLFTMGSPLKQLYNFAFPDLYDWVTNPRKLITQLHNLGTIRNINVKEWVNAYRSGDYIGRNIWTTDTNKNVYKLNQEKFKKNYNKSSQETIIREYCIGAGGHTHYWNTHAPEIAQEIDELIGKVKY